MLQWANILLTELLFTVVVCLLFGFIKLPKWLRMRKLARGFPWGYYPDRIAKSDYFVDDNKDFLYDTGTAFGGIEGFGDFGEFSGFGEMGEFGGGFGGGGD